jgi:hypothetical protein
MCECTREDEELHDQEQDQALSDRGWDSAFRVDGVEIRGEDHYAEEDLVGDLDDDVGDEECFPGICF